LAQPFPPTVPSAKVDVFPQQPIKSIFKQTQWKTANPLWESGASLSQSFHHFFGSTFPKG